VDFLKLQNVSYSYDGEREALCNLSFSIQRGRSVCVAGANGSGKSTLLELIAGCMKPSSGDILIDGESVFAKKSVATVRKKTGLIFQEPDNQLFMPTVWEDVAFGVMNAGTTAECAREAAMKALAMVDGCSLAERRPYTLSGGEKQRVAIASVLIMESEILLLDEPTASLDPRARKNIIRLLKDLNATKIIASHDLDMALDICDELIFLHQGKVAARSPVPGLLLDEGFLQGIGLELPLGAGRSPLT
jgi:cobalt/nickel transport system ATP-binding protein